MSPALLQRLLDIALSVRDTFNHHIVFGVGVLLVAGYFLGKLAEKFRLPAITGYLVAGLVLGDSVTGVIHAKMTETLRTITEVALGIIAFSIGSEFELGKLRRLGRGIAIITIVQIAMTFAFVWGGLVLCGMELPYAALLGAIASATAPAATVVIIQTLRARGDFVDTLYGVVALDDAGCVVLFSAVFAMASGFLQTAGNAAPNILAHVGYGLAEIGGSLLLGLVQGVLLYILTRKMRRTNERLILSLGCVFLFTAVAVSLHLSLLLTNMMAGTAVVNLCRPRHRILRSITPLTPPLYAAFFAVAGTELNLGVLWSPWVLGIGSAYVAARALGKYAGVWLGAVAARRGPELRYYLGLCMIPQAGVAIALVLLIQASPFIAGASAEIRTAATRLTNIVLFGVMVNELIGPPLSKLGIIRGANL